MAASNTESDLRRANFRLCRLCVWPNYSGLGFNLEGTPPPPYTIRTVESNSPAAAGGVRIRDLVLAVNNQDVSNANYQTVTQAIKNARDSNGRIELLVIEKRFYEPLKSRRIRFDPTFARSIDTPPTMPRDYVDFPKNKPRTCNIRLQKNDQSFGFEVVNGPQDIGAFIQDIVPNSPAGQTALRKSDRILEIDDKFVDNEPSRMILEKLFKAKKNRAVKLYVVDTSTYKYFQENGVPLTSKDFPNSSFARNVVPSTYINVNDIPDEPTSADVDIPRPTFPIPTTQVSQPLSRPGIVNTHQDDIRLCTITRANATDTYGLELNYHRRDQFHSLKLTSGRGTEPSNAALAGVKTDDHLIEVNGENIANIGDEQVKQRIRAIKYPQPLQILVADTATYNHYKQQNKMIHSRLPTVKKLPEKVTARSESPVRQRPEPSVKSTTPLTSLPVEQPSSGVAALVDNSLTKSRISAESTQSNRRQHQLQHIPGFPGFGFSVNSNQGDSVRHKISQIAPNSPAAQQGLRVGDYILTVNNQSVENMNADEFKQFLRTSTQNTNKYGNRLLLEVINEDSYQPPILPDDSSIPPTLVDPPSTITSMNGNVTRESSYYRLDKPTTSPDGSQKSIPIRRTISPDATPKLPRTPQISTRDEPRTLASTQRRASRNESEKSLTIQPIPYQNGSRKLATTQQTTSQPYHNGYGSPPPPNRYSGPEIKSNGTSSPSLYRSREHLSRGTVDVVSENHLLRYCRLNTGPGQAFGFQLKPNDDKHFIYNIQPDSPAARAGLHENDRLIEVDDENIERKSSKEVARLIRNAAHNGRLRLFIAPNSVKVLSKRSGKSLSTINDDRFYQDSTSRSRHYDSEKSSIASRNRSVQRHYLEQNNRYSSEPTEPLPRQCVLQRDPSFRGCGFQLIKKADYDTPIITEIASNSPAKRSGLTEGDHIIYVDSQNVQNFHSFNDITSLIQRRFEENGEVTLVTLTGPGYQVLKRRGGYLESTAFDYQCTNIEQLKPRLCKLRLTNQEHDFGFAVQYNQYLYIKSVEQDSSADVSGLRQDDIVIEINGQSAKNFTIHQVKEITETSKQGRKLDLLVIDIDGYRFSVKHAIPLNSFLAFVQTKEGRTTKTNNHIQQEPVYL